jgi:hypothetical protein
MAQKKYIEKMMMGYEQMFGEKPVSKVHSPLEKGDHPELDTSELLDQPGVQQYQLLIGSAKLWLLGSLAFIISLVITIQLMC